MGWKFWLWDGFTAPVDKHIFYMFLVFPLAHVCKEMSNKKIALILNLGMFVCVVVTVIVK